MSTNNAGAHARATTTSAQSRPHPGPRWGVGWDRFALFALVLAAVFAETFWRLYQFTQTHDLYAYTLVVPFVSCYLAWAQRSRLRGAAPARALGWASGVWTIAVLLLVWATGVQRAQSPPQDHLWLGITAFCALLIAGGFFFLGTSAMRPLLLPMCLLFWMAPLPQSAEGAIEHFFQSTSAVAASVLFALVGAPVVREGMFFHVPGIVLEVARECSGIRSSVVLFIVSWAAAYLFLRRGWTRVTLALFVIPLAILRNGLRIFTIGVLCWQFGPEMIHSWVHRKGGPLFFGLSLAPFIALLVLLRIAERRRRDRPEVCQ